MLAGGEWARGAVQTQRASPISGGYERVYDTAVDLTLARLLCLMTCPRILAMPLCVVLLERGGLCQRISRLKHRRLCP